jgi:peptide deformylase
MVRDILKSTNQKLRARSKEISQLDKKTNSVIADLYETLKAQKDPEGIGLAAPQIGKNIRMFLMRDENIQKIIINPKVISMTKIKVSKTKQKIMEGCLSLPHFYSPLTRAEKITISYKSEKWEDKTETFSGLSAQIVQHEIDHLDGVLFVDHVFEQKLPLYEYTKKGEWVRVELE